MRLAMTTKLNIADSASGSRRAANRESEELLLHAEERGITSAARRREKRVRWTRPLPTAFQRATHRVGTPESGCPIRVLCRKELCGDTRHYGRVSIAKNRRRPKQLKKVRRTAA